MATEAPPEIAEADLRSIAAQLDAGDLDAHSEVEITPEATPGQDKAKPEGSVSSEGEKEVTQESQEPSTPAEPDKDLDYRSEYEKLKKDYERQDRSWKRLNEEKEALAKLKATVRPDETRIAGDQFSAEEYEAFADKALKEGGSEAYSVAQQAMARAKQIRQQRFTESWQSQIREAMDEDPELADANGDLARTVNEILRTPDWHSFKTAVKLAKARKLESSVPGLMGEIEQHKKEIERLNKAMEVGGTTGLPKRDTPKRFEEMGLEEQSAYLRRRAGEVDDSF